MSDALKPVTFRPTEATEEAVLYLQAMYPSTSRTSLLRRAIIELAFCNGWDGDPVHGSDVPPRVWLHGS